MSTISYKCPNCGGDLQYDPDSKQFKCEFCLSSFAETELSSVEVQKTEEEQIDHASNTAILYRCPSCGAEIITDETTAATFCFYCHNPIVLAGKLTGDHAPDCMIPFSVSKKEATRIFLDWIKKKKYVPESFYADEQIDKISGVYFPYLLYSCDVDGDLKADCKKIRQWSSGSYQYTETTQFAVKRKGTMSIRNMARNALKRSDKKLVEGVLPFDMDQLIPFHMSYLSGFIAEKRDMETNEFEDGIKMEIDNYAARQLKDSLKQYSGTVIHEQNIHDRNGQWVYAMLPVWTMTYKDRDSERIYYFAMNGQDGNLCGELPVNRNKLLMLFLKISVPLSIVFLLLSYFI